MRTPNAFRQCEVFLLLRPEIHNKRNHNRYLVWNQRDIFHISNGNETILRIEKKIVIASACWTFHLNRIHRLELSTYDFEWVLHLSIELYQRPETGERS